VRKRSFRLMLKLRFSTPKVWAGRTAVRPYTPRPQRGREAGGEGTEIFPSPPVSPLNRLAGEGDAQQGALPCAPTPLAHSVGERLGVRAKKARLFPMQRTQVLYPYQGEGREWGDSARAGISEL